MKDTGILILEDHPIVSRAIASLIDQEPGLLLLGTGASGESGIKQFHLLNPDLVVVGLATSTLDGDQLTRLLLEIKPNLKVLIFSEHKDENYVYQALSAGAHGYVLKESPPEELLQAIHYIIQGGTWVSPSFSPHVISHYLDTLKVEDAEKSSFDRLTGREKEVFFLIASGRETKEIAEILGISGATVAKHRIALMKKLNLKNLVELTKFAIRNGLAELEDPTETEPS